MVVLNYFSYIYTLMQGWVPLCSLIFFLFFWIQSWDTFMVIIIPITIHLLLCLFCSVWSYMLVLTHKEWFCCRKMLIQQNQLCSELKVGLENPVSLRLWTQGKRICWSVKLHKSKWYTQWGKTRKVFKMNLAWKEKILIMMKIKNEECDENDIHAEK